MLVEASGGLHADRLYQVSIGAGFPAAALSAAVMPCFQFQLSSQRPALVELVWPQVVLVDEESIFSTKQGTLCSYSDHYSFSRLAVCIVLSFLCMQEIAL